MNTMLMELVRVHWVRVRAPVIVVAIILFTIPLAILRSSNAADPQALADVGTWLRAAALVGKLFPLFAALAAGILGFAAWNDDTKGRHVYALTLPISRERYVLYRFVAGAAPILVLALALLAGCLIASWVVHLPSGVHAYPLALGFRFLVASLVCYSVTFALGIATRRALIAVLGAILVLLVAQLVAGVLDASVSPIDATIDFLTSWPGPFAILIGNWSLFDV